MFTPLNTGHAKNVRNLTVDNYTNWYIFNFHSCYYHFVEDLAGRKLWYNPDPLLLWGNGILRTLALASGSTSFSGLDADHHIQLVYRFFYFINHWANWFSVMAFITQYGGTISLFHCIEHLSSILYPLLYRVQTLAETLSGL